MANRSHRTEQGCVARIALALRAAL
jgi:hypothetical protein